MSNSIFDITSMGINEYTCPNIEEAALKLMKLLQEAKREPSSEKVFFRFNIRLMIMGSFMSNSWDIVRTTLTELETTQHDQEFSWYKNVSLYYTYASTSQKSITMEEAIYWKDCINHLDHQCKPAMLLSLLNTCKEKLIEYPSHEFLQMCFSDILSPIEIEGTFAEIAGRVVQNSLENQHLLRFDEEITEQTTSTSIVKRLRIDFFEKGLCLGETEPFCFDVSMYNTTASLRSFLAQYKLPTLNLDLSNIDDLTENQNLEFKINFFNELRDKGLINSTDELIFPLDEQGIKDTYRNTLQQFFQDPLPENIADVLIPALKDGKKSYDTKLDCLSGFVQHDAIALFIKAMVKDPKGISDNVLHQDMIRSLKSCLQLRLKSIDISCLDKEDQDQAWELLSQHVMSFILKGQNILLPSGSPKPNEYNQSQHAIYVAIRHVEPLNSINIIIMNGGDECDKFHKKTDFKENEMEHYFYKQSGPISVTKQYDIIKSFIRTVLSFPHEVGTFSDIYENPNLPLTDHPKHFPLQLMGSCAVHNLKYGVKALYGFSETEMGNMMRSGLIGINKISIEPGDVEDLDRHPLFGNYVMVEEVGKKLKIKSRTLTNFDNAMSNKDFLNEIQPFYETYPKDQVHYCIKQLFSSEGKDFTSLKQFTIELSYDLETKSPSRDRLTLQEYFMTEYGWNRALEKGSQDLYGTQTSLIIYRTMSSEDWEKLNNEGDYSVLEKGHLGDFKQALRYFLGKSRHKKVMVAFALKPGMERVLFSSNLAFPKEKDRSVTLQRMTAVIGAASFPVCNKNEGISSETIGIKSESEGEAGFSIGIGGGGVASQFKHMVASAYLQSIDGVFYSE